MAESKASAKTKKTAKPAGKKGGGEAEVLEAIAAMPGPDRAIAERLHAIVGAEAPALSPRLWYGMPAYALGNDVVCFFQSAAKFKTRYSTLGFQQAANLDDGNMWPVAFAVTSLSEAGEARIAELVRRAASRGGGA